MWNNRRNKNSLKGLRRHLVISDKISKTFKCEKITTKWRMSNEINKELIRVALYPSYSSQNRINNFSGMRRVKSDSMISTNHHNKEEETQEILANFHEEEETVPPLYSPRYIKWDGFEDEEESVEAIGQMCSLCEKDLSSDPLKEDINNPYDYDERGEDYYYNDYKEDRLLPDVSVLCCGHCFHSTCLESVTPDDQSTDPPCFFCLSLYS